MKVIALDSMGTDFSLEKKVFRDMGASFLVTYYKDADALKSITHDADVLMCNDVQITAEIIKNLDKCKMITCYSRDFDNVDIKAAGERGICVTNAPQHGAQDAAEHTMALLLSLAKRIPSGDKNTRAGRWNLEKNEKASRLFGKTLGIIGAGPVAQLLEQFARAFSMHVQIFDFFGGEDAAVTDFASFLKTSDFISLHAPFCEDTQHMMGMLQFKHMKKDALLINTAHGGLINENELVFALLSGEIGGAALDVYASEPLSLSNRLITMENVILTPHVARNSKEAILELHQETTENVVRILRGDTPQNVVNQKYIRVRK